MTRLIPLALVILILSVIVTGNAFATTYYIAANGSDSNNGTSKTSPWMHAPGMTGCSNVCGSTTPQPGDSFILRGGDSWHYKSGAGTPVGLPWTWSWSGSSANCQLNAHAGPVVETSCIYVGVDQTWYSGSSWVRPILNDDNPPTNSYANCAYDESSVEMIPTGSTNYWIFDNFEITGECWSAPSGGAHIFDSRGTQTEVTDMYFHGWTFNSGAYDGFVQIGSGTPITSYMRCDHNVFDGSDSTLGNQANKASGFAIYNACTEIDHNVFNRVSNGCICEPKWVHDNLFEFIYEPSDGSTHGNIIEWNGGSYSSPVIVGFYNNIMHDTNEGEGINTNVVSSPTYVFNNVSWLYRENPNGTNGNEGNNCYQPSASSGTWYFLNNTTDYPCSFSGSSNPALSFQNNHFVGFSGGPVSALVTGGPTVSDNGNELWQSESTANAQGYTPSTAYAPLSGGSTIGAGTNLTSFCTGIPNDAPMTAACKAGIETITYNTSNHTATFGTNNPRPSTGPWDVGAYVFSAGDQPAPPTGLSALVE